MNYPSYLSHHSDQMLVELEIVKNPERVGFYSGIIVSFL